MSTVAKRRLEGTATLENVRIMFRNFSGKATNFNVEGNRNFAVVIPPDVAQQMKSDGWNIKVLEAREEGDDDIYILRVKVNYKGRPPRVVMITSKGKTPLDEELVSLMDVADILTCDVTISPYNYDVNGSQGVTAYLKSLYVTIQEDYLDMKYDDVPYAEGFEQLAIEGDDGTIEVEEVLDDDTENDILIQIGA